MNYRLVSAILKSVWAIEPRAALAHGQMLSFLFNDESFQLEKQDIPKPFATNVVRGLWRNYDEAPEGSVAVIPIVGELMKHDQFCGPVGTSSIGRKIVEADNHENIDAIILKIDSPGGTVDGTEALANIVKATSKPIISFVDGMMCSAALWVGSAADEIIASASTDEIGSIGVMVSFADMQPIWESQGVKFHKINADQSKDKNKIFTDALAGNYESIKKEMLNPLADAFINAVKENRPNSNSEQYTGKVFFAKDLIGTLIDSIGNLDYAIECALLLVKKEVKIIKI